MQHPILHCLLYKQSEGCSYRDSITLVGSPTVGYQGPLWRSIREDLRRKIDAGIYPAGSKLPSTRELADQYETSPVTVRRAIDSMIELGELTGRQGVGVFVVES